jgi:GTP-binding protein HflX
VGYTNAGKSTLFNALVKARAYAADQLFATLDTTTRQLYLGEAAARSLSDTVGFIRDLPHGWWRPSGHAAGGGRCRLLLHVVDAANPAFPSRWPGAARAARNRRRGRAAVLVFNKLDALTRPAPRRAAGRDGRRRPAAGALFVSARTGEGLGPLREELARRVQAAVQARKTAPEGGAHAIGHNGWMNSREIDE